MRFVLAGNGEPAIGVLDRLLETTDASSILCIGPGPGQRHSWQRSLAPAAVDRGVACLEPEDVNAPSVLDAVRDHRADLVLSVYYTQLFKPAFIESTGAPILNAHPSLLPRHRGVAPLIWAIVEGDATTGVTIHMIDEGIDTGDIVLQRSLPIDPDDTGLSLYTKVGRLAVDSIAEVLQHWQEHGSLPTAHPQSGEASHHSRRDAKLNHVDWTMSARRVTDVVRALAPPFHGAFTHHGEQQIVLHRLTAGPTTWSTPLPPGTIDLDQPAGGLVVWCGDGPVEIASAEVDDVVLTGEELVRRLDLAHGDRLG